MKKNKKNLYIIYTLIMLLTSTSVLAAGQMCLRCGGTYIPYALAVLSRNIILIIQMLVPIIIIITGMIELLKSVMAGDEKKMDEVKPKLVRKIIAGVVIFLIFTIVKFGFSFLDNYSNSDTLLGCASAFINKDSGVERKETCPSRENNYTYPSGSIEEEAAEYCETYCDEKIPTGNSSAYEACINGCKTNYISDHSDDAGNTSGGDSDLNCSQMSLSTCQKHSDKCKIGNNGSTAVCVNK